MISLHEIQHTWRIKSVNTPLTLELRAIKDKRIIVKQFYEKDYQSIDDCCSAFEVEALALNGRGFNIYYVSGVNYLVRLTTITLAGFD